MRWIVGSATAVITLSAGLAAPAAGQATHVVRMVADAARDEYRFEPAMVTVHPNDVLVFRVVTGPPHSVVFESEGLSAGARRALNSAMPARSGDLSSPLLTSVGKEFRMVVPLLPAGSYPFYCLPHRAYDMRGELRIK
jgi:plastocyanin